MVTRRCTCRLSDKKKLLNVKQFIEGNKIQLISIWLKTIGFKWSSSFITKSVADHHNTQFWKEANNRLMHQKYLYIYDLLISFKRAQ